MGSLPPRARRDVERALRDIGLRVIREGGNHTIWGADGGIRVPLGRHRQINGRTLRAMRDQLGPLGDRFSEHLGLVR